MQDQANAPELSRIVEVSNLAPLGETIKVVADDNERAMVANRLGLAAIHEMNARLTLAPWRKGGWHVSGPVQVEIEQICVVTAEEFRSKLVVELNRHFMHEKDKLNQSKEIIVDPLVEDDPDVIDGDRIDLGELAVEALALSLDPYPRMPGADFKALETNEELGTDELKPNPFAALAKLRDEQ